MLDLTLDLAYDAIGAIFCMTLGLCLAALCGHMTEASEDLTDWSEE